MDRNTKPGYPKDEREAPKTPAHRVIVCESAQQTLPAWRPARNSGSIWYGALTIYMRRDVYD